MNVPEEAVEAAKIAYFDVANPGMRAAIEAALLFLPRCCPDCRGDE